MTKHIEILTKKYENDKVKSLKRTMKVLKITDKKTKIICKFIRRKNRGKRKEILTVWRKTKSLSGIG